MKNSNWYVQKVTQFLSSFDYLGGVDTPGSHDYLYLQGARDALMIPLLICDLYFIIFTRWNEDINPVAAAIPSDWRAVTNGGVIEAML